jgi:hypothetical protein
VSDDKAKCPSCKRVTRYIAPNAMRCGHCLDEMATEGRHPAFDRSTGTWNLDKPEALDKSVPPERRRLRLSVVRGGR